MTKTKRPIEGEPMFKAGTFVLTPSGRTARVDSHTDDGKANLTYVESPEISRVIDQTIIAVGWMRGIYTHWIKP